MLTTKITRFLYSLVMCFCGILMVSGCNLFSNPNADFIKNLNHFCSDKDVTAAEFTSLKGFVDRNPGGLTVGGKKIATEQDLVDHIHSLNITGSAEILKIKSQVSFDILQVYLENSASMKGFSNAGNPQFTAPIVALFNVGDSNTSIVTGYVGAASNNHDASFKSIDKSTFESNIANGRVATGVSSPLDKILSLAIDSTSDSTVTCLISDCILSGSNAEISRDREFTKRNLPLLEQRIRDAVKKAEAKGLSLMIYQFETGFTGTYFDYRNAHHKMNGQAMPYYMLFIGDETNLEKVRTRLERESAFKPKNILVSYRMGDITPIKKAMLMKIPGTTADITVIPAKSIVQIKNNPMVPVDFKVRLSMQNLPEYYADADLLRKFLKFRYTDTAYNTDVDRTDFIVNIAEADHALKTFDVTLQMESDFVSSFSGSRRCRLTLPGFADPWYLKCSADDDTVIDEYFNSTFALDYFIGGILKGLDINIPETAIDVNITIQKQ